MQLVVLGRALKQVTDVDLAQIQPARQEFIADFRAAREGLEAFFLYGLAQQVACRTEFFGFRGVHRVAQVLEGRADHLAGVVQQGEAEGVLRAENQFPAGPGRREAGGVVRQAGRGELVRNGVPVPRVEVRVDEAGQQVLEVLQLLLAQRLQEFGPDHRLHHVIAGVCQVVTGPAALQLGDHGLVALVGVDNHVHAVRLLEVLHDLRVDVIRPHEDSQGLAVVLHGGFRCGRAVPLGSRVLLLHAVAGAQQQKGDEHGAFHCFSRRGRIRKLASRIASTVNSTSSVLRALMSGVTPFFTAV